MAPVKFPTDLKPLEPNIVYFKEYGSKIPSSKLYCEESKWRCEYNGYHFSNTGRKVGIAVGVVGEVLVLAGIAAGIWWCRRKTKKGQETENWKVERGPSESSAAAATENEAVDTATRPSAVTEKEN